MPRLRQRQCPGSPVVVESARGQSQKQLLLGFVEHPDEIPVGAGEGDQRGRRDFGGRRLEHGARPVQVALAEPHGSLELDDGGRRR
jgi:hypothetical protein